MTAPAALLSRDATGAPAATPGEPGARRADIEGLRAVAILAVLVFHAGVPHLAGGFVGVDVFFVISGFLITQQLLRPLRECRRLSLKDFYARRARRILPAAGLVLLAVLALGWLILPPLRQVDLAHDALASALYVPNWWFISGQIDYSRAGLAVSPVLHYWSLGVEEQFYLVWPVLVLAAAAVARRRRLALSGVVLSVLGVVITSSFVLSMVLTRSDQPWAFLGSPTRAWQFGAGALLAVWLPSGGATPVAQGPGLGTPDTAVSGSGRARFPAPPGWIGWIGLAAIACTVHVNMALVLKFLPSYLLQPTALPEVPRRRDTADDAFLFHQGAARGLAKVRFADWRTPYDAFADVPNVAVFREQAEGLVDLVTNAGPDADQAKDLDLLLALGELFTLVVYGQLILEQASLTDMDSNLTDLLDQVFDVLIRDFSAYAVDLYGNASSTKAQQLWALEHVRKPAADTGRYDRVWQQVRDLAGAYEMRP